MSGYVNTQKALLDATNDRLVEQNNELAQEINEGWPQKKNASGEPIAGCAVTFVLQREIYALPHAIAAIKESYGKVLDMLEIRHTIVLESNSGRFATENYVMVEPIPEDRELISTPLHLLAEDQLNPLSNRAEMTSDHYTSLEQHQISLRYGGVRPSVAILITNAPESALRFMRGGTKTRRGLGYVVAFDEEGSRNNNLPSVGSRLDTNYSINVFLNTLLSALRSDDAKDTDMGLMNR